MLFHWELISRILNFLLIYCESLKYLCGILFHEINPTRNVRLFQYIKFMILLLAYLLRGAPPPRWTWPPPWFLHARELRLPSPSSSPTPELHTAWQQGTLWIALSPATIDKKGVYYRPKGYSIWCVMSSSMFSEFHWYWNTCLSHLIPLHTSYKVSQRLSHSNTMFHSIR